MNADKYELRLPGKFRNLPAVVQRASPQSRIGLALSDAEFDSERYHACIRPQFGVQSMIPAKRGKKIRRIHGVRAEMRRSFPRQLYRRRALIETLFSPVKRKLSAWAPAARCRCRASRLSAWPEFQSVPPEATLPFLEDINRPR